MTPHLKTASGILVNLKSPKQMDIYIGDIAIGLSNLCRFSGQLPKVGKNLGFYSVAAHSLAVSEWIEANGGTPLEALCGLLHDASEAYLNDLTSPAKSLCPDYRKLETKMQKAICKKFNIPYPFPEIVHKADKLVLGAEKIAQATRNSLDIPLVKWLFPPYWNKKDLTSAFISRYNLLKGAKRK